VNELIFKRTYLASTASSNTIRSFLFLGLEVDDFTVVQSESLIGDDNSSAT